MITAYTDGACSGNPGPGGWGAVIDYGDGRSEELSGERRRRPIIGWSFKPLLQRLSMFPRNPS